MIYCTKEMFKAHKIDPAPKDIEKNRLCPNISHKD